MSARIKTSLILLLGMGLIPPGANAGITPLDSNTLANELGWVDSTANNCGGYYLEQPFLYPDNADQSKTVGVTGSQALFSQHGTTVLEGNVSLVRFGQEITANKAYVYRSQTNGKITSMDLQGDVHLREPNTLVLAKRGNYNFESKNKSLLDILYRTTLMNGKHIAGPNNVDRSSMQQERRITNLTAWGQADEFAQNEPKIYELKGSSFSTCPPKNPAWKIKASHLVLNKNTGRGYATNVRLFVKKVPVFYIPYFNFSIDHQRKSGFLWPTFGYKNGSTSNIYAGSGAMVLAPFYWNMAPNYDMTITPGYLSWRGVRIADKFRYLSSLGRGDLQVSVLPNDRLFSTFQTYAAKEYANSSDNVTQAELSRLLSSSTTRKSLSWHDKMVFNEHWSTNVDFSYVGDDYYMRDFGDISDTTQNQLLQEGDLYYKGENWNFIGRLQTYQTLHPIESSNVSNQYRRAPQLVLNGDYPDQAFGLEYFINTEATHFDIRNTPGIEFNQPIGNRFLLQPGVSLPIYTPYFFVNPRAQVSMRKYSLYQTTPTDTPEDMQRTIPIFDMAMGAALNRNMTLFNQMYEQTLEPQIYYTYIPYKNQSKVPTFDTTVSTLTYDQIFNYNRFIGIDRIGDANQVGVGISSRILNSDTGLEKVRMGVGEIIYFANRRVTFCNDENTCYDNPQNPSNRLKLSPISGLINYAVNPVWNLDSNAIFDPIQKQLNNATIGVHYKPDERHIINLGYGYVFTGQTSSTASGGIVSSAQNNLKLTDISFSWPATSDLSAVGRWSQNWNQEHLQNLVYGLQYDTCCWAARFVGGRTFIGLDAINNNKPIYSNDFYIQFSLKGIGEYGSGNPAGLLSTITGYNTKFGQEF